MSGWSAFGQLDIGNFEDNPQRCLMQLLYHVCFTWTKHPYQGAIGELGFYYCIKKLAFFGIVKQLVTHDKAQSFWEAFSYKCFTWLLNLGLLPIIIPKIFFVVLIFISVLSKRNASFSVFLPRHIKQHLTDFAIIYF